MKKIIILILLLSSLTACQKNNASDKNIINPPSESSSISKPKYTDNNPITIGLYQNNSLVHNYQINLSDHKDIGIFEIYYTNDETLENNNQLNNWKKYYNNYQSIDNYKIGFNISFETINETIDYLVLDPSEMHHTDYLYIYLYDDINQEENTWYSHLETKDLTDKTIYSSIKLYLANRTYEIISPITLQVFTYDEDDFDEFNHYRGNSSYTITIETK